MGDKQRGAAGLIHWAMDHAERLKTNLLWRLGMRARVFVGDDMPLGKMKKGDFFYRPAQMRLYGPMPDEGETWPITEMRAPDSSPPSGESP